MRARHRDAFYGLKFALVLFFAAGALHTGAWLILWALEGELKPYDLRWLADLVTGAVIAGCSAFYGRQALREERS